MNKYWCPKCNQEIPTLHSDWEGINKVRRVHWFVNFCPRCGTVTDVEENPFYYANLLPRIGKIKTVLFIQFTIGVPFQLIAWLLVGRTIGIIVSSLIFALAVFLASNKVHEVEQCPYEYHKQYPELIDKRWAT